MAALAIETGIFECWTQCWDSQEDIKWADKNFPHPGRAETRWPDLYLSPHMGSLLSFVMKSLLRRAREIKAPNVPGALLPQEGTVPAWHSFLLSPPFLLNTSSFPGSSNPFCVPPAYALPQELAKPWTSQWVNCCSVHRRYHKAFSFFHFNFKKIILLATQ